MISVNETLALSIQFFNAYVIAVTYILEVVTPLYEYVEELAYWALTLFHVAKNT